MPAIALLIVQGLLQYGPDIAEQIAKALHATDYSLQDWLDLIAKCRVNTKQFIKDTEYLVDTNVPIQVSPITGLAK